MSKRKDVLNVNTTDQNYVFQLTDAEKKAQEIIDEAKKRKASKLKKSRDEAQKEIEICRIKCEAKLSKILKDQESFQDTSAEKFDKELQKKAHEMIQQYKANKSLALKFVVDNILNVTVESHKNLREIGE
jgi:ATP synthase subunit G